jgi:hypothetical protein
MIKNLHKLALFQVKNANLKKIITSVPGGAGGGANLDGGAAAIHM